MSMPTNRKRTARSRKDTGLTGAEEMFVYGKTEKPVNPFQQLDLSYPISKQAKAKVEALNGLIA